MHSDIHLNPRVGVLDMALLSPDIGVGIIISRNNDDLDFTQVVQCSTECISHVFIPCVKLGYEVYCHCKNMSPLTWWKNNINRRDEEINNIIGQEREKIIPTCISLK